MSFTLPTSEPKAPDAYVRPAEVEYATSWFAGTGGRDRLDTFHAHNLLVYIATLEAENAPLKSERWDAQKTYREQYALQNKKAAALRERCATLEGALNSALGYLEFCMQSNEVPMEGAVISVVRDALSPKAHNVNNEKIDA